MRKYLCPLISATLLVSCAGSFKSINPSGFQYTTKAENSDAELFYKYDVLRERDNKKYSRKELKAGVRIIAVRITNTTGKTITIGENAKIYSGNSEVRPWPPDLTYKKIKQKVPFYLFYLLLTPTQLTVNEDSFPIGYILGPGLAAGNMAVASTANGRLKKEMIDFDVFGKTIKPGETLYGLIGIPEIGFLPLRVAVTP